MSETVFTALGIKIGTAVFGFAGGIVSLAFIKDLTRAQAAIAVAVGLITAVSVTPLITALTGVTHPGLENGIAFLSGLCAMSGLPLIRNALRNKLAALSGGDVEH